VVFTRRNLLYTGVTRGKRLVVLVGQKKAVAIAVRNASSRRRWSKLDEWFSLAASGGSINSSFSNSVIPAARESDLGMATRSRF
jgi:exodeoxyribonuclease V alpha subunit